VPELGSIEKRLKALEARSALDSRIPPLATELDVRSAVFPPMVRVYRSANQELAHNTPTAITFPDESFDTNEFHSTTANTNRLTIREAGVYMVGGQIEFAADADGDRLARLYVNGATTIYESRHPAAAGAHREHISGPFDFAVGDYVELIGFHTAGNALQINPARFWMYYIGTVS
jgi:hypothetical protein